MTDAGSLHAASLFGEWRIIETDGSYDLGHGVEVDFHPDGKLTYTIHQSDRQQLILLTWRLENGFLVTNQPSHPTEIRSKVQTIGQDELVLELDGTKTRLVRVGAGAS